VVQLTLRTNGTILRAENRSEAIYGSIDIVVDKIHRQIARYKGKRVDRWHGNLSKKQRQTQEVQPVIEEVRWSYWATTFLSSIMLMSGA
jgi:putative sigma-54 modulation protein